MSIDHTLPFLPRGLLRVRAANPEFQQLIRNAEIILAADVRNPRNTWVVFLSIPGSRTMTAKTRKRLRYSLFQSITRPTTPRYWVSFVRC